MVGPGSLAGEPLSGQKRRIAGPKRKRKQAGWVCAQIFYAPQERLVCGPRALWANQMAGPPMLEHLVHRVKEVGDLRGAHDGCDRLAGIVDGEPRIDPRRRTTEP